MNRDPKDASPNHPSNLRLVPGFRFLRGALMRANRLSFLLLLGLVTGNEVLAISPGAPLAPRYRRIFSTWKDNPHSSHVFFSPSAIPLEQGNGYYSNSYILMHSAWYAPMNNISIGAGFQMMSVLASLRTDQDKLPGGFIAIKATKRFQPAIHAGVFIMGSQLSTAPTFADTLKVGNRIGTFMAQATFGTGEAHVTVNLGYHRAMGRFTDDPQFGLSGQWRITEPFALVTENWWLNFAGKPLPIYSAGCRFIHRKLAADVALVYNKELAKGFGSLIPYFGFSLRF